MAINNQSKKQDIPVGWDRVKLREVAEVYSGATPKTSDPSYWNGDIDWVTPRDLSSLNERSILYSERRITRKGLESCSATLVAPNSIIMSSRAPIGYLAINKVPVATNQGCKNISPKPNLNVDYLYYYLTHNIDSVKRLGAGSTFAEVGKSAVESVEILLPPLTEQKRIAEILSTVDEEIQKTDAIISVTEKLKRGLMQQFFTRGIGHTKFKETTLGKVIDTVIDHRGLTPKKLGGEWTTAGIPAISAMNVKNGEIVKLETIRYVNETLFKRWMPEGIENGDVLLTSEAPLGEAYLVKPEDKYCLSQRLFALRPRKAELIGAYLYYFLTSPAGQGGLLERATGSTAKGIRQTELLKISISYPEAEEQKRIAGILSAVDEKISVNKKLKEKLTLLKKGLMQDLLSGSVRTG